MSDTQDPQDKDANVPADPPAVGPSAVSSDAQDDEPGAPPATTPVPRSISSARLAGIGVVLLSTLWVGVAAGPTLKAEYHKVQGALGGGAESHESHGDEQYYTCGMHPWVIQDRPGNCPICGMELVPLDPSKFSGEVTISPTVVQNIGVKVEEATEGTSQATIRTVGTVDYDETRLGDVNLKVAGWIEKLHVDYLGAPVRKGQALFELYSPELYTAEEEYLIAFRAKQAIAGTASAVMGDRLLEAARTKLSYFDIGPAQIAQLEKRGTAAKTMTIRSPYGGVVIEKHAVAGMKVIPGMTTYRVADLSRVWVMVTLYEYQSQGVKVGQHASMTLAYDPGKTLEGKVVYVYPYLDQRTRQVNVRLEFPNPKNSLKPGMYTTVMLDAASSGRQVLVNRAAVIDTGDRQVAFVSLGEGRFEPRMVRKGAETADGKVEILEGLKAGEQVVVSGQFLIDSEARMREALARMMGGNNTEPGGLTAPAEAARVASTPSKPQKAAVVLPDAAFATLKVVLDNYLSIGEALAADSTRDTGVLANRMAEAADATQSVPIPGEPHFWHRNRALSKVKEDALALAQAGSVADARQVFASLSANMSSLLRATGVPKASAAKLEENHCPMYPPGNKGGAVWIQKVGAVRNPYFGKAMSSCADRREPFPVDPAVQVEAPK